MNKVPQQQQVSSSQAITSNSSEAVDEAVDGARNALTDMSIDLKMMLGVGGNANMAGNAVNSNSSSMDRHYEVGSSATHSSSNGGGGSAWGKGSSGRTASL